MSASGPQLFPVFLNLDRRLVVVVGEGKAIDRRARQLIRYGADVFVITPDPSPWLLQAEADGLLSTEQRAWQPGDLNGAFLVVCASPDPQFRLQVAREADSIGCPINVVEEAERCSFIIPSMLHRGAFQLAISTAGLAPAVSKAARQHADEAFGEQWGTWVELIVQVRALATERFDDASQRGLALAAASDPAVLDRLAAGEDLDAEKLFAEIVAELEAQVAEASAAEESGEAAEPAATHVASEVGEPAATPEAAQ